MRWCQETLVCLVLVCTVNHSLTVHETADLACLCTHVYTSLGRCNSCVCNLLFSFDLFVSFWCICFCLWVSCPLPHGPVYQLSRPYIHSKESFGTSDTFSAVSLKTIYPKNNLLIHIFVFILGLPWTCNWLIPVLAGISQDRLFTWMINISCWTIYYNTLLWSS